MDLLTRVNFTGRTKVRPNQLVSYIETQSEKTHLYVVFFPFSCLVYVNRLKKKSSSGHQSGVKDSWISICSSGERTPSNGAMRRPSAPASNTIHLRGGRLRSIPAFTTFPPPLNTIISPTLLLQYRSIKELSRTYPSAFPRTRLPLCVGVFLGFFLLTSSWLAIGHM